MNKKEVDKRKKEKSTKKYQESLAKNKEIILVAPDGNVKDSFEDRIKVIKENEIGYFHLIQSEKKGNIDQESVKLLVPYIWQQNESDEENIELIKEQKEKYEKTFNGLDREAEQISIDAVFRAGNFAKNLETGIEELLEDQTKKEYDYNRLIEITELWLEDENYRLDKLAEDAEKAQLTVLAKMGALALKTNEIEDIISSLNESRGLDVEKLADKFEADLAEQSLIYAPAIYSLEDKVAANNYQNMDEYLLDLKKEVLLNRFEALNMLFVLEIGTALILRSNGSFFSSAIGTAIIASAISVGETARSKAKVSLSGKEADYTLGDIINNFKDKFKDFFDLSKYLGEESICLKFALEAEEEIIAEFAIDGFTAWESVKINTPNNSWKIQMRQLANSDYEVSLTALQKEFSLLNDDENAEDLYKIFNFAQKEIEMPIKLKEFLTYYGSIEAIGEVINLEQEAGIERDFVAFFASDLIGDFDINASSQLAVFKEIEYDNKVERFIYNTTKNQDSKNKIVYDYEKRDNKRITPLPYLSQIEEYFSQEYLEKRIKEGIKFINAGDFSPLYSQCHFTNDTYFIKHTDVIDKFAKAYGIDLKEDEISYEKILNTSYNSFIKARNFINLDYNYIVSSEIRRANHGLDFFRDKTEYLTGSKIDEEYNKELEEFEFWTGLGCINQHQASNPQAEIKINNHLIGQNLERIFSNDDSSSYIIEVRKYEENFKDGDRVLQVRYLYKMPKILTWQRKSKLKIKYRYKSASQWQENKWNEIIIQGFASDSCDYGISLPDKGDSLAGSRCQKDNEEIDEELNEERVELEAKKIKLNGEYLMPNQITPLADDDQLVYQVKEGDRLWSIAQDFLGDGEQWQHLLKEDGSTYTKEEAEEIKAGDKVVIPVADNKRRKLFTDEADRKYVKDNEGNLFIYCSMGEESETLAIVGFSEGDYGLWLEQEPPYYLTDDELIDRNGRKKADKSEVLDLEENQWLEEEERIKEDKLWLYGGEKIEFPTDCEEVEEEEMKLYGVSAITAEVSNDDNESGSEDDLAEDELDDNEIEGNDSEDGSSGDELFVCAGAELECNFGDDEADLKVVAGHNVKIDDELMANMMDNKPFVNVGPFGQCSNPANPMVAAATAANAGRLQEMPCIPVLPAPWLKTKMDVRVNKLPALLESSQLMCVYGGVITIEDAGQNFVKEL